MTQVGSVVLPGYEGVIFWIGLACVIAAIVGLLFLFFWPRAAAPEKAGGISVKMGDRNKVGGIGNKYGERGR